jgi:hypothetical protein
MTFDLAHRLRCGPDQFQPKGQHQKIRMVAGLCNQNTFPFMALAKERADDVLLEIQNDLLENPKRGPVIKGTSRVRKSRAADSTRGKRKSGGLRYMYYYIERDSFVLASEPSEVGNKAPANHKARHSDDQLLPKKNQRYSY